MNTSRPRTGRGPNLHNKDKYASLTEEQIEADRAFETIAFKIARGQGGTVDPQDKAEAIAAVGKSEVDLANRVNEIQLSGG